MPPSLRRSFTLAYGLGLFLCVLWPLAIQVILTRILPRPGMAAGELATQLGYTFTGLSVLAAVIAKQRFGKVLRGFQALDAATQSRTLLREVLLFASLFELSAVYGILTYALGGPHAERYARTFICLPAAMFFVCVPRWELWRKSS